MHLEREAMIRLRDDSLAGEIAARYRAHLRECADCAAAFAALLEEGENARGAVPLASIVNRLREWKTNEAGRSGGSAVRARVADELRPYLGGRSTDLILSRVAPDNRDLLACVENVLGQFLGPKAAANVVTQIVDSAIVGN